MSSLNIFRRFNIPYSNYLKWRTCSTSIKVSSEASPPADFLLQNLKNAQSSQNVLSLVETHSRIMNSKHIMQALRSVFELRKQQNSQTTNELLKHPQFEKLCRKLKSQAGVFDINETIDALKIVSYVGVPSDSNIVQVLLQLIRHQINGLNLKHLMFLDFLLRHFKRNPMINALQMALPLVFEIQLPLKMDRENALNLAEYLHYSSKTTIQKDIVMMIVEALMDFQEFDGKTAKSIVWSLADLKGGVELEPLYNRAINDLIVHLDEITYEEIETTLTKIIAAYSMKTPFYYNQVLFDSCANQIVDLDLGLKPAIYVLKKFNRMYHFNELLVKYMAKQALEPNKFQELNTSHIYCMVVALALTPFKPSNWEELKQNLTKKKHLAEWDKSDIIWQRYAASLCLLDIFKVDVITKSLSVRHLKASLRRTYMSDYENYMTIYWSIQQNRPELVDLIPKEFDPKVLVKEFNRYKFFPLEPALQSGLGSSNCVLTNIFSKAGHLIDHAILVNQSGSLEEFLQESYEFVEDIPCKPNSQLVLIYCLRPINYTINNSMERQATKFAIKTLKSLGFPVVLVNIEQWENLQDFEKIPFLMQQIQTELRVKLNSTQRIDNV